MKSKLSKAAPDHRDTFDLEILKAAAEVSRAVLSNGGTENDALNASRQTARYKLLSSGGFKARRSMGVGRIISGVKLKKKSKEISRLATSLAMSDNWDKVWREADDSENEDSFFTDDVSYDVSTLSEAHTAVAPQPACSTLGEFTSDIAGGVSILHRSVLKLAEGYIQNHKELTSEHSPETNTSANNKERLLEVSELSLGILENEASHRTGKFGITSLCCTNSAKNYSDLVSPTFSAEESKTIDDSRNYEEDETKVENSKNDDSFDKEGQDAPLIPCEKPTSGEGKEGLKSSNRSVEIPKTSSTNMSSQESTGGQKETLQSSVESMGTHTTSTTKGSSETSGTFSGSLNQDHSQSVENSMELSNDSQFSSKSGSQSSRKRFFSRFSRRRKKIAHKQTEAYSKPIESSNDSPQESEVDVAGLPEIGSVASVEKSQELDRYCLDNKESMDFSVDLVENSTMTSTRGGVEACVRQRDTINFPVELTENNTMSSTGKGIETQLPNKHSIMDTLAELPVIGSESNAEESVLDECNSMNSEVRMNISVDLLESSTMTSTKGGVEACVRQRDIIKFPVELTENSTMSSTGKGIEAQLPKAHPFSDSHNIMDNVAELPAIGSMSSAEKSTEFDRYFLDGKQSMDFSVDLLESSTMNSTRGAVEACFRQKSLSSSFPHDRHIEKKESSEDQNLSKYNFVELTENNTMSSTGKGVETQIFIKSNHSHSNHVDLEERTTKNLGRIKTNAGMSLERSTRTDCMEEGLTQTNNEMLHDTIGKSVTWNSVIDDIENSLEDGVEDIIEFSRIDDLVDIVEKSTVCSKAQDVICVNEINDFGGGCNPVELEESRDDYVNYSLDLIERSRSGQVRN